MPKLKSLSLRIYVHSSPLVKGNIAIKRISEACCKHVNIFSILFETSPRKIDLSVALQSEKPPYSNLLFAK